MKNCPVARYDILGKETAIIMFHGRWGATVTPSLTQPSDLCLASFSPAKQLHAAVSISFGENSLVTEAWLEIDTQASFDGGSVGASSFVSNADAGTMTVSYEYFKDMPVICPVGKQNGTIIFESQFRDEGLWEDGPTVRMNYEYECKSCCSFIVPFFVEFEYTPTPKDIDKDE